MENFLRNSAWPRMQSVQRAYLAMGVRPQLGGTTPGHFAPATPIGHIRLMPSIIRLPNNITLLIPPVPQNSVVQNFVFDGENVVLSSAINQDHTQAGTGEVQRCDPNPPPDQHQQQEQVGNEGGQLPPPVQGNQSGGVPENQLIFPGNPVYTTSHLPPNTSFLHENGNIIGYQTGQAEFRFTPVAIEPFTPVGIEVQNQEYTPVVGIKVEKEEYTPVGIKVENEQFTAVTIKAEKEDHSYDDHDTPVWSQNSGDQLQQSPQFVRIKEEVNIKEEYEEEVDHDQINAQNDPFFSTQNEPWNNFNQEEQLRQLGIPPEFHPINYLAPDERNKLIASNNQVFPFPNQQSTTPNNPYAGGTTVNSTVTSVGTVGITSNRALSPVRPPSLPSSGNNFETVGGSAFTHSLASPFVQNAFPTLQSQPVEFNHAITYVNKIKNRFHSQPDKYKQFLEILHTYQKEQRNKDTNASKHLTEHEVYNQVTKLFENQEDLLAEFGQFLPDATPPPPPVSTVSAARQNHTLVKDAKRPLEETKKPAKARQDFTQAPTASQTPAKSVTSAPKRSLINPSLPSAKKVKYTSSFKDVSLAEAGKYGTLNDFAFFDKVRSHLRSNEAYDNFIRALQLFNFEVFSKSEVLQLLTPFLSRAPELLAWFKDFLGHNDQAATQQYEPIQSVSKQEKLTEEQVLEIDFSTCKRLGASYCALPKNHMAPKCSGRTMLCKEVLNDVWVSFPTWSEDSTFVTSRKTQFEEYIYRCEDERFELDVVIETNTETIRCLEAVAKKMSRMSQEELQEFQLDDCLGGTSPTIHQRAIRRLYGEKANDIIEGLKRLPQITVPMVLRRLKAKEEEWREAQKGFNKIWREQVERFYLKSLDHQGINFKQGDIRALRSKALITEIETIYDERQEQNAVETATNTQTSQGPHLILQYRDRTVLDDACNLLLHHVRRQSGIQKEDKRKIKQILKRFLPDLFNHPRMEMSDDENDEGSSDHNPRSPKEILMNGIKSSKRTYGSSKRSNGGKGNKEEETEQSSEASAPAKGQESRRTMAKRDLKTRLEERKRQKEEECLDEAQMMSAEELRILAMGSEQLERYAFKHDDQEENYRLFFANNTWYVFLRLHQILCERLTKLLETAVALSQNEPKESRDPKNSAAIALRMKPKPEIEIEDYYPTFLEMVRNLLDGNMETNTYEDQLQEMFGIHAYIAYTMDKVVANAVRQLQNLVTDEACQKCLEFYLYADRKGGTGGPVATAAERVRDECLYQCRSEKVFGEENCVKVIINCEMTMELLDGEPLQPNAEEQAEWFSYVKKYTNPNGTEETSDSALRTNPSFLKRNRRKPTTLEEVKVEPDEAAKPMETSEQPPVDPTVVRIKQEPDAEVVHHSSVQCSFNPSSYKMVYVCDGEDYLYRNRALPRAQETHKSVSTSMWKKFEKWHEEWLLRNTTRKDRSDCEAWLKENPKHEVDVRSKKVLKVITSDNVDEVPYHQYKRYLINSVASDRH